MRKTINGALCDTDTSKLIATVSRLKVKLYQTVTGYFFFFDYYGGREGRRKPKFSLIPRGEAIALYNLWQKVDPDRLYIDRLDWDEVFED